MQKRQEKDNAETPLPSRISRRTLRTRGEESRIGYFCYTFAFAIRGSLPAILPIGRRNHLRGKNGDSKSGSRGVWADGLRNRAGGGCGRIRNHGAGSERGAGGKRAPRHREGSEWIC